MKSFAVMLAFFTRIPVRAPGDWDDVQFKKGIKYFFIIGLIVGLPVGAVMLLKMWAGPYLAAFAALVVYLLLSGGLHVDGMADTMDGFAAHRDKEGTLAIMKDSHIGTFGVLAVCLYAIGMTVSLAQTQELAVWLFPLVGRSAALICARLFGSAQPDGLGKSFIDGVKTFNVIVAISVYIFIEVVLCLLTAGLPNGWLLCAGLTASFAVAVLSTLLIVSGMAKRLSGITGDLIGFSIEFSQLVFLLNACIVVIVL